jgi:O-antigen/teichoic acid export membrane protein
MFRNLRFNSLLTGSATYLVSNILNAAIPFALLPVLTRYLEPSQYGQVAMFQILLGALGAFVGLNVVGAAGRKYYDSVSSDEIQRFIAACLQILIASTAVILLITLFCHEKLSLWFNLDANWIFAAVLVSMASVVVDLRLGQWQVRKQARLYGALQIAQSSTNMALSLLLVIYFVQGANGRIEAQVLTSAAFLFFSGFLLHRDKLFALMTWSPRLISEALHFGAPLIPHVFGGFLLISADRFIINQTLGLESTGIYMVAVQFSLAFAITFDAINRAFVPWLFERLKRDVYSEKLQIVRYTYAWYLFIFIGVALAFWLGPWLVLLIAGEKYAQAGEIIGWLALGQGFGGMYLMVTNYIFYSRRTGILSLMTVGSGLLNILLVVALAPMMGLEGAAVAFSISMGLRFVLVWWVAQKKHPMPWFYFNLSKMEK